ncbi:hypothetical protein TH25_20095 [Thalassospira profundimaris]|uniref:Uncharacterized protein n=1 Tax=Thalassospira profundimaris TaxID=502049 RepID=A0A367WS54_9PROT|nr:hypothetical protein [Thalassospira profundimaris]RCK44207.1 hypothetical protein TH25_20095 [Thalassospira profundimaris]
MIKTEGAGSAGLQDADERNNAHDSRLTRLRDELLRSLPADIRRARKAYHRVADEAAGVMDAKGFVNYQAACKAALAHVESLIKLLRGVREGDLVGDAPNGATGTGRGQKQTDDNSDDMARLIADARKALHRVGED